MERVLGRISGELKPLYFSSVREGKQWQCYGGTYGARDISNGSRHIEQNDRGSSSSVHNTKVDMSDNGNKLNLKSPHGDRNFGAGWSIQGLRPSQNHLRVKITKMGFECGQT